VVISTSPVYELNIWCILRNLYILKGYMSNKKITHNQFARMGSQKAERYIQPSILMTLKEKPSHGYDLIQNINRFEFIEGNAPPGMIYRHLREMEDNGLVVSEWKTDEVGPAKRIYRLTSEGDEVLGAWIDYMGTQAKKMLAFIEIYRGLAKKS
jgi:PadR family transcriptional regulator, regulatory protein PadR